MNAHAGRITPALCEAADDREARAAAELIERYRRGLIIARANGDRWQRHEAKQCLEKVEGWAKAIADRQHFAATNALIFLGRNAHGPRIDAAIAAGERRSAARDPDKED